jgi:hypothetical protein
MSRKNVKTASNVQTFTPPAHRAFPPQTDAARDSAFEAMLAEVAKLKAENEAIRAAAVAKAGSRVSLRVSEKGAVSLYGLGRFPVTLYREQWEALLGQGEAIKAFIKANEKGLSVKGQAKPGEAAMVDELVKAGVKVVLPRSADETRTLVKAVRDYAQTHYAKGGWDVLVECWSDEDIVLQMAGARTANGAIAQVAKAVRAYDDQRKDIQAEAF